jgi:hypothetical protein
MAIHPEIKKVIDSAAKRHIEKALENKLLEIGLDVSTPSAVRELQHDMVFIRLLRDILEQRALWWVLTGVSGLLTSTMFGAIYVLVRDAIK